MKKTLLLFVILSIAFSQSCKKDSAVDTKPTVADIPVNARTMRMAGDSVQTDLPDPSILILNADYSWKLNIEGAQSFGTYTWTPIDAFRAQIKFTITQWTNFNSDPAKSNKLKNILLIVDKCEFPGPGISQVVFIAQNYATFLSAYKQ